MFEVPVFYASTEGQTRRIAERMADRLRRRGLSSAAIDVGGAAAAMIEWRYVRGAMVGASLHAGRHQRQAATFVTSHRRELNERPSAFFSVSLAAASKQAEEVAAARAIAADFVTATRWHPDTAICLAGRLAYSQYGFVKRFFMKRIARKEGGPTDTSRDYEYTDWEAVDRFADAFAAKLQMPQRVAS
jgi:menaquinone-dependent protoporphyrinogen oxidase